VTTDIKTERLLSRLLPASIAPQVCESISRAASPNAETKDRAEGSPAVTGFPRAQIAQTEGTSFLLTLSSEPL
jgi:hypothetical protein